MIGRLSPLRHAVVGAAIAATTVLSGIGVIGGGDHSERYETWQVVISPEGADGLRFAETFDQDFGDGDRHGHEGYIPHDMGRPVDVVASSPDAPDDLEVLDVGNETRIRIGNLDRVISGQHRYTLGYTLPTANLGSGVLSIDVLDPDPVETDLVEIALTGMVLDDPRCFVGAVDSEDECVFVESGGVYRAVIEPLPKGAGVTVEATIVEYVPSGEVAPLPIPERRSSPNAGVVALGMAALGAAGALPVYLLARRKGRNEVFAGGAADAAYGTLPAPRLDGSVEPPPPVRLVPDDEMADLATIEFVPPQGIDPWEAAVLLTERLDADVVEAWLSGLVGSEAIQISEDGANLVIASGPTRAALDSVDGSLLDGILEIRDPYTTGTYDARFAAAWNSIARSQRERIAASGWWRRMPPGGGFGPSTTGSPFGLIVIVVFTLVWSGSGAAAFLGVFRSWVPAVAIGLVFPAVVALLVYRAMLPVRSAQGSALALRAESFRRFLHASESRHVEWAWSNGLLREYSAWAVALGEADAWATALDRANIPVPARVAAGPIIVHRRGSSMRTSRTAPTSSGGGGRGGGGSRGGRVGGGGGGRSRGSF